MGGADLQVIRGSALIGQAPSWYGHRARPAPEGDVCGYDQPTVSGHSCPEARLRLLRLARLVDTRLVWRRTEVGTVPPAKERGWHGMPPVPQGWLCGSARPPVSGTWSLTLLSWQQGSGARHTHTSLTHPLPAVRLSTAGSWGRVRKDMRPILQVRVRRVPRARLSRHRDGVAPSAECQPDGS